MGYDHTKDQSSESDEDSNVRHDRFKSERFNKDSSTNLGRKDNFEKRSDLHDRRRRDRSPRSHRHREVISSSSSCRSDSKYESRSDHDRKDRNKKSHSRSSRNDRNRHKSSGSFEKEEKNSSKTTKNLSSLLKSFDKQVESKRNISENLSEVQHSHEIGPALPPHLKHEEELEKDCPKEKPLKESGPGPSLPPHYKSDSRESSKQSNDNDSDQDSSLQRLNDKGENLKEKESTTTEGPVLPPHLQKQGIGISCNEILETSLIILSSDDTETNKVSELNIDNKDSSLPTQPESETYGPALPPKVEFSAYGPALPPKIEAGSYGPSLPPDFKISVDQGQDAASETIQGQDEESDDEDMVGPLPEGKMNMTQYQLDLRAADIRRKLEEEKSGSSKDIKKREEWMLELPPEKASNLGLGPRKFRKREAPDMSNRSEWTDTPADKLRKAELAEKGEVVETVNSEEAMKLAFVQERNEMMDKITKQSKEEDRSKSLLHLHQKKLKKKKKEEEKEGKKNARRPFDRNIDLQVNRFDDAQKKAIFKKAQLLDTRFSSGESKYL